MAEDMFLADCTTCEKLLEQGFTELEARKLIYMKDHVGEETEYRELREEQHRLDFIRWLVQHNRISK